MNIDDDLRSISKNQDYSKEGKIKIYQQFLSLDFQLIKIYYACFNCCSYRFLRDELKEDFTLLEVYLYTSKSGKKIFADDYEKPVGDHLAIDTGKLNIGKQGMKYSMFIGRQQPWHEGHRWLINQRLNEGKNIQSVLGKSIKMITQIKRVKIILKKN